LGFPNQSRHNAQSEPEEARTEPAVSRVLAGVLGRLTAWGINILTFHAIMHSLAELPYSLKKDQKDLLRNQEFHLLHEEIKTLD